MKGKLGDVTDGPPRAGCPLAEIRVISPQSNQSANNIFVMHYKRHCSFDVLLLFISL